MTEQQTSRNVIMMEGTVVKIKTLDMKMDLIVKIACVMIPLIKKASFYNRLVPRRHSQYAIRFKGG